MSAMANMGLCVGGPYNGAQYAHSKNSFVVYDVPVRSDLSCVQSGELLEPKVVGEYKFRNGKWLWNSSQA